MPKPSPVFRYRICKWHAYNRALINRGRLTVWFDEQAVAARRNTKPALGPGAPRVYTDLAIDCALVLRTVYHLSLRAGAGVISEMAIREHRHDRLLTPPTRPAIPVVFGCERNTESTGQIAVSCSGGQGRCPQGDRRIIEPFKAQPRPHSLFHSPMVLCKAVIEIVVCSPSAPCWKSPFLLESPYRFMPGSITLPRDLLRDTSFFDRLLQEALSCRSITVCA